MTDDGKSTGKISAGDLVPGAAPTSPPAPSQMPAGMPASFSAPELPGQLCIIGNRYEVVRRLGEGGMGTAMLARDRRSGSLCVVKVVRDDAPHPLFFAERLRKEMEFHTHLMHDHIVRALDTSSAEPFYVLPYYPRGSLRGRSSGERDGIDHATRLRWLKHIALALDYAHKRGICHYDLSPDNVLLDDSDRALVADFGLARAMNQSLFDSGPHPAPGKLPYMAPERRRGECGNNTSDIYSWGVMAYELVKGRRPEQPPPADASDPEKRSAGDRRLLQVAEWATQDTPANRYAEFKDVLDDLERIEAGREPLGPSRTRRHRTRRNPIVLLAAGCAVVAVVAAVTFWYRRTEPSPPMQIELVNSAPLPTHVAQMGLALTADADGDGNDELWFFDSDRIEIVSADARPLRTLRSPGPYVEAPGMIEALRPRQIVSIPYFRDHRVWVDVIKSTGELLKQLSFDDRPDFNDDPELGHRTPTLPQIVDVDQDGRWEVLLGCNDGFEPRWRGVICFDYESGKELWRFQTAAQVMRVLPIDRPDNARGVILGLSGTNNGYVLPDGRSDAEGALYLLDARGRQVWRRGATELLADVFAGSTVPPQQFTDINPVVVPRPGANGLCVIARSLGAFTASTGAVHLIDPETGKLRGRSFLPNRAAGGFLIHSESAEANILLIDVSGQAYLLNSDLEMLGTTRLTTVRGDELDLPTSISELSLADRAQSLLVTTLTHVTFRPREQRRPNTSSDWIERVGPVEVLVLDRQLNVLARHPPAVTSESDSQPWTSAVVRTAAGPRLIFRTAEELTHFQVKPTR
jgi:serine/threonine protein kinase